LVPEFKAGFHCGKVTRGEIGDVKSESAYLGDVVNTTARIMSRSGTLKKNLLLSADLFQLLPKQDFFQPEKLEEIALRGKEQSVIIYGLSVN
jgi:adenylate cyclase